MKALEARELTNKVTEEDADITGILRAIEERANNKGSYILVSTTGAQREALRNLGYGIVMDPETSNYRISW